jgi:hypothetical protein
MNIISKKLEKWIENIEKSEQYIDKEIESLRFETTRFNNSLSEQVVKQTEKNMKKLVKLVGNQI